MCPKCKKGWLVNFATLYEIGELKNRENTLSGEANELNLKESIFVARCSSYCCQTFFNLTKSRWEQELEGYEREQEKRSKDVVQI